MAPIRLPSHIGGSHPDAPMSPQKGLFSTLLATLIRNVAIQKSYRFLSQTGFWRLTGDTVSHQNSSMHFTHFHHGSKMPLWGHIIIIMHTLTILLHISNEYAFRRLLRHTPNPTNTQISNVFCVLQKSYRRLGNTYIRRIDGLSTFRHFAFLPRPNSKFRLVRFYSPSRIVAAPKAGTRFSLSCFMTSLHLSSCLDTYPSNNDRYFLRKS